MSKITLIVTPCQHSAYTNDTGIHKIKHNTPVPLSPCGPSDRIKVTHVRADLSATHGTWWEPRYFDSKPVSSMNFQCCCCCSRLWSWDFLPSLLCVAACVDCGCFACCDSWAADVTDQDSVVGWLLTSCVCFASGVCCAQEDREDGCGPVPHSTVLAALSPPRGVTDKTGSRLGEGCNGTGRDGGSPDFLPLVVTVRSVYLVTVELSVLAMVPWTTLPCPVGLAFRELYGLREAASLLQGVEEKLGSLTLNGNANAGPELFIIDQRHTLTMSFTPVTSPSMSFTPVIGVKDWGERHCLSMSPLNHSKTVSQFQKPLRCSNWFLEVNKTNNPTPRGTGGFLFIMFPHQEPWVRGPPSKNLVRVIGRNPPPGGGFSVFPHQEPWVRGPPSKHQVHILRGGCSYSQFLME